MKMFRATMKDLKNLPDFDATVSTSQTLISHNERYDQPSDHMFGSVKIRSIRSDSTNVMSPYVHPYEQTQPEHSKVKVSHRL